jgi:hypothetical protein
MDAEQILATPAYKLFQGDAKAVKSAFHKLAKIWHPDINHDARAAEVSEYIIAARDKALNKTKRPSVLLERRNGTKFQMEYIRATQTDGLTIYTGETSVAYLVPDSMSDLVSKNSKVNWKFATKDMEAEMSRFLPPYVRTEDLNGGSLMSDLIQLHLGRISPLHVSWMLSRLNNIACYLEWSGLVDFAILPEYLLVDLESHGVALCGPRLFMTEAGKRPIALPARVLDYLPNIKNSKTVAETAMDRSLIRSLACNLLGDPAGTRLKNDPEVKKEVSNWVLSVPASSAVADYEKWMGALGQRKFIVFEPSAREIYS